VPDFPVWKTSRVVFANVGALKITHSEHSRFAIANERCYSYVLIMPIIRHPECYSYVLRDPISQEIIPIVPIRVG